MNKRLDGITTEVLIIGAGIVGLTLCALLEKLGVACLILEKNTEPTTSPGAVSISDETQRIWQAAGVLSELKPFILDTEEGNPIARYYNRSGETIFEIKQPSARMGYAPGATILLREIEIRMRDLFRNKILAGRSLSFLEQTDSGLRAFCQDRTGNVYRIEASYLVGCDGRGGVTAGLAGIEKESGGKFGKWLVADVSEKGRKALEVGAEFMKHPSPAVTVPLPEGERRWEILLNGQDKDEFSEQEVAEKIHGIRPGEFDRIHRYSVFQFSTVQARNLRKGRVFLAGDAAGLMPPFAGMGMVTGLGEAYNLAWKLAARIKDNFPDSLLDSYDTERKPFRKKITRLSSMLGMVVQPGKLNSLLQVDFLLKSLSRSALAKKIELRGMNTGTAYATGFFSGEAPGGEIFIQPRVRKATGEITLLDEIGGNRFRNLSFSGSSPESVFKPESPIDPFPLKIMPAGTFPLEQEEVEDLDNTLSVWRKTNGVQNEIVLRPDQIIYETS